MRRAWSLLVLIVVAGCGGSDGPPRSALQGKVSFNGQPVPVGEIVFEPDSSKGNNGPQSVVQFKQGQYVTDEGKGIIGGPYKVTIRGFDGVPFEGGEGIDPNGKPLFDPYTTHVEIPASGGVQDFDVVPEGPA